MDTSSEPLVGKQGAKEPAAEKNCHPMLPSLHDLADKLSEKYPDGLTKLFKDHHCDDGLSTRDAANRDWLSTIQDEYMKMLMPDLVHQAIKTLGGFWHPGRLTAALTAAERMLAWVIAHPTFGSLLNDHRYIIDQVIAKKGNANNVDKATVHLLSVFGLMTLVIAPVKGSSSPPPQGDGGHHVEIFDKKMEDKWVQKARAKLQNKGDRSEDVEAALGMQLMDVDSEWFVDHIQTHASYVLQLSHHHKAFQPRNRDVWLESRTMLFFSNFLTNVVSALRLQANRAQVLQTKIMGSFFTGAIAVINTLQRRDEGASHPP
jgi:hypothetical protein